MVQVPFVILQKAFDFPELFKFLFFLGNFRFFVKISELVHPPGLEPGTL